MKITPVILCGGSGTRLWPLSRKGYPKQFAALVGNETLFQASAQRVRPGCESVDFAAPVVITNSDFRFIVTKQLNDVGIDPGAVLIEPDARNTAPAVLAAAEWLLQQDPEAVMLVTPSDHVVPDDEGFRHAVASGLQAVAKGDLVTFGIKPTRPETGYGYLELADGAANGALPLSRFVEKPDLDRARQMLDTGNYLWNAGIFLFSAKAIVAAFQKHAPQLVDPVRAAVSRAKPDLGFLRLAAEPWDKIQGVSIDYAVMERAENLSVVPFDGDWSDLGSWETVWREIGPDAAGVATSGGVTAIDCKDTLMRSESDSLEVVGIGLENIVVVAMPDAVLVADKTRSQDVKLAVEALKNKGATQAEVFPKDHRPWGWFESLVIGDRFQVKRIVVHPGAALSLQSHVHRSEHWIVVSGTAKVTVDDKISLLSENQSVYIPLGAVHRLENPGKLPMVLIEVQTGAYLGEDDITRYEDVYARSDDDG